MQAIVITGPSSFALRCVCSRRSDSREAAAGAFAVEARAHEVKVWMFAKSERTRTICGSVWQMSHGSSRVLGVLLTPSSSSCSTVHYS